MSKTDSKQADFTKDEHWGKGGRYVINAEGKRVPAPPVVEETDPAAAGEPAPNPAPAASNPAAEADQKKTLKEKNRG